MGLLDFLFGPSSPEERVKRLTDQLGFRSETAERLDAEVERIENANPMLAALGNAFGGIGAGRSGQASAALNDLRAKQNALEQARDKECNTRLKAAQALGALRQATAVPALTEALGDRYLKVRVASAVALGECGGPEARAALEAALADEKQRDGVKEAARAALATFT